VLNASLDIPTNENIIWFIRKLYIHIIMKGNQYLFSSSIIYIYIYIVMNDDDLGFARSF